MPLHSCSESGLFQPESLSRVMEGRIVFAPARVFPYSRLYLASDRKLCSHRRTPDQSGPSTGCRASAPRWESMT